MRIRRTRKRIFSYRCRKKKHNRKKNKHKKNSQDKVVKPVPCTGMSWMNLLIQEQMLDKAVEMGNGIRLASDPFKMCMVF